MAWPGTLSTKSTGELVDADDWNDLVNGINHLGNTHDHSGDAGDGGSIPALGDADYDSGWFAVTTNTVYTKAHSLGVRPRLFIVLHSTVSDGDDENVVVDSALDSASKYPGVGRGTDTTNIYVQTANHASYGVLSNSRRQTTSGYYRILAWT